MSFAYRGGELCAESVPLSEIAARFGTPCYVYSQGAIEAAFREFQDELAGRPALVCYSVKANSNLSVLALLARLGSGFDIVSGGELARVLAAGGDPGKVVFSGVGKTAGEIKAALSAGVLSINLESEQELFRVNDIAGSLGLRAPVAFRVNPDVDPKTHPYISTGLKKNKFGVAYANAESLYLRAAGLPNIRLVGVGCHIGSLMMDSGPFVDAAGRIAALVERLARSGIALEHIDLGGGMGIQYRDEKAAPVASFIQGAADALGARRETLIVDPGRSIVGNAGALLTRVEYLKPGEEKNFAIVDAAMNDLIRPSLYDAWHEVRNCRAAGESDAPAGVYDVVGPICESGDFLAQDRTLAVKVGDLLALLSAGAYGMAMSSNYNSRPRAAEVMVHGSEARLVRPRETVDQLFASERELL